MKRLVDHILSGTAAREQLGEYRDLLQNRAELEERIHVIPFFKACPDLCLLFSHYIPALKNADVYASEFVIYGDFIADLIVGDRRNGKYLLVEFENGTPHSVFKDGGRTAPAWAPRFEAAFSQLVDWIWKLEDMRVTNDFTHVFGRRDVKFYGLIVLGKGMNLRSQELQRLDWRQDKLQVDSKPISIVSYDTFLEDADGWLKRYHHA